MAETPQEVLDFWYGLQSPGKKDDAQVREVLGNLHQRAAVGELDGWAENPRNRMALILLLDQVPRHLYRDNPRTYATDEKAQSFTELFVAQNDWQPFTPLEKFYCAMPWLHSEDLEKQTRIHPIYQEITPQIEGLEFMGRIATIYLETIQRFGRFPHRNDMLGRETTPEEATFLEMEWGPRRRKVIGKPL